MNTQKKIISSVLAVALITQPLMLSAAPGTLSQDPLFIGNNVQPNILFLVDDSGSMDWEVLRTSESREAHSGPTSGNLDFSPNDFSEDREHCFGYNVMAYNPNDTYDPWVGVDEDGNPYVDQSIDSARNNPFRSGDGTRNLLNADGTGFSAVYGVWVDANLNGIFDANECPTGAADDGGNYSDRAPNFTDSRWVFVSGLTSEAQRTNYANWYTYYRKREYVAKRALSEVINESSARVGLATLHDNAVDQTWTDSNGNGSRERDEFSGVGVGTLVRDVDNITSANATAETNKNDLMENLFRVDSRFGTPLRQTLERAGNYIQENGDLNSILSLFGLTSYPADTDSDPTNNTINNSPIFTQDNGGSCQKNFTILLSDGFWNGGAPNVGNTDTDGAGEFDGGSYADSVSNTLADVAMEFYERDLAPSVADLPADLEVTPEDPNRAQHMVTYTIAFGVDGTLTDADAPTLANESTPFNWPDPTVPLIDPDLAVNPPNAVTRVVRDARRIDDMRHAAWNGRGLFLNASNPQSLIDSFNDTISNIDARDSSASSVSFNSTSLDNGALLFRAQFNPISWIGRLSAQNINENGLGSNAWRAEELLDGTGVTAQNRQIITFNGDGSDGSHIGIPFTWPADFNAPTSSELSSGQIDDLLSGISRSDAAAAASYGADLVDFLRGDHSEEVGQTGTPRGFRNRASRLGDIIHSAPVFVGSPNERYPDNISGDSNQPYSGFISSNLNRRQMVYVGANDGMLHGFDANTGSELFAYIPNFLFSDQSNQGLHYLADVEYAHRSYVDLTPSVRDVFVGGQWRTYLVGGGRAGGKGIFVLDVTNPESLANAENNADDIAVTEFSDPDLGLTYSQITIAKMNNGEWAAIFGNGYKNTGDDSGDGTAKLFVLYLDGSGPGGRTHEELVTNVGDDVNKNGLSTPEVLDMDGNGTADRIYAGDLFGNMWAFDVSSNIANDWGSDYGTTSDPEPLFVARDGNGNIQPITSKPSVVGHPTRFGSTTAPNLIVTFGTGQYLTENDAADTSDQTFYGVWDAGISGLTRSRLQLQTLSTDDEGLRSIDSQNVDYSLTGTVGWGIDLIDVGERQVVDPVVVGSIVFFNTLVPESTPCSGGGSGFLMNVSLLNGGNPPFPVLDIPNNSGIYAGIAVQGVPTGSTFVSNVNDSQDADRYVNTSRGVGVDSINFEGEEAGRTSWTNLTR